MVDLEQVPAPDCCSPATQEACCEPGDKAECCGAAATEGGCGCSAGASPKD